MQSQLKLKIERRLRISDDSGWWTGKAKGKEGYFPGSYVEKI